MSMLRRRARKRKAVAAARAGVVVLAISVAAGEMVLGETAAGDGIVPVGVAADVATDNKNRRSVGLQLSSIESQMSGSSRLDRLFCLH